MPDPLVLVSHPLCPYVQRAAISLAEKSVPFDRIEVDLADKPSWFRDISPLGKVPLLRIGESVIFESAVILEYLEETRPLPLHPRDPLARAEHRSWIEFGSAVLATIAGFYSAQDRNAFDARRQILHDQLQRLEDHLGQGPWFAGKEFSLVDAVYAPVFRYFDAFDRIAEFGILGDKPRIAGWRSRLATRPSVMSAVSTDFSARLWRFLGQRDSYLSSLMPQKEAIPG